MHSSSFFVRQEVEKIYDSDRKVKLDKARKVTKSSRVKNNLSVYYMD